MFGIAVGCNFEETNQPGSIKTGYPIEKRASLAVVKTITPVRRNFE